MSIYIIIMLIVLFIGCCVGVFYFGFRAGRVDLKVKEAEATLIFEESLKWVITQVENTFEPKKHYNCRGSILNKHLRAIITNSVHKALQDQLERNNFELVKKKG